MLKLVTVPSFGDAIGVELSLALDEIKDVAVKEEESFVFVVQWPETKSNNDPVGKDTIMTGLMADFPGACSLSNFEQSGQVTILSQDNRKNRPQLPWVDRLFSTVKKIERERSRELADSVFQTVRANKFVSPFMSPESDTTSTLASLMLKLYSKCLCYGIGILLFSISTKSGGIFFERPPCATDNFVLSACRAVISPNWIPPLPTPKTQPIANENGNSATTNGTQPAPVPKETPTTTTSTRKPRQPKQSRKKPSGTQQQTPLQALMNRPNPSKTMQMPYPDVPPPPHSSSSSSSSPSDVAIPTSSMSTHKTTKQVSRSPKRIKVTANSTESQKFAKSVADRAPVIGEASAFFETLIQKNKENATSKSTKV